MRSEEETGQQEIRTKGRQGRREAGLEGEGDSKETEVGRHDEISIHVYSGQELFQKQKELMTVEGTDEKLMRNQKQEESEVFAAGVVCPW